MIASSSTALSGSSAAVVEQTRSPSSPVTSATSASVASVVAASDSSPTLRRTTVTANSRGSSVTLHSRTPSGGDAVSSGGRSDAPEATRRRVTGSRSVRSGATRYGTGRPYSSPTDLAPSCSSYTVPACWAVAK